MKLGTSQIQEITDEANGQKLKYCKPLLCYTGGGRTRSLIIEPPLVSCGGLRPMEWKDSTGRVIKSGEYKSLEAAAQQPTAPGVQNPHRQYLMSLTPSHYKAVNKYDSNKPEHMKYIKDQYAMSEAIAEKIAVQHNMNFPMGGGVPIGIGQSADPNEGNKKLVQGVTAKFRQPVFQSKDNPALFLEVCQFYTSGQEAPQFTGLDGRIWSYRELEGKVVTWIPLIKIKDVFENQSTVKPRKYIVGGIIVGCTASGYADYQQDTQEALAADESLQAMYASSLAEMARNTTTNASVNSLSTGMNNLSLQTLIPQVPVPTPQVPLPAPQTPLPVPQVPLPTPQMQTPLPVPQVPLPTPQAPTPTYNVTTTNGTPPHMGTNNMGYVAPSGPFNSVVPQSPPMPFVPSGTVPQIDQSGVHSVPPTYAAPQPQVGFDVMAAINS